MRSSMFFSMLGLIPVIIWGTAVGLAGSVTRSVGPLTSAGLVYGIAGFLSLIFMASRGTLISELRALSLRPFLICFSFFGASLASFWLGIGIARNSAIIPELGVVNYLWPTLTLLFGVWIVGQKVTPIFFVGLALATAGVVLPLVQTKGLSITGMSEHVREEPFPYLIILISAITWALYSNYTRKYSSQLTSCAVAVYLSLLGVILVGAGLIVREPVVMTPMVVREIAILGVADAFAYLFWDIAMRRGNPVLVGALSYITPLLSVIFAGVYLGTPLGVSVWVGAGLVVLAAILCKRSVKSS